MSDAESTSRGEPSLPHNMDAIQVVSRHPEWYFRSGQFDAEELVSLLVQEALRGGASAVDFRRLGDWMKFEADVDWLKGDVAAFFAPLSYHEGGRNSSRVEVVLTAFCEAVVTVADTVFEVKSSAEVAAHTSDLPEIGPVKGRAIIFLPPAGSRSVAGSVQRLSAQRGGHLRLLQGEGENRIATAVESFIAKSGRA